MVKTRMFRSPLFTPLSCTNGMASSVICYAIEFSPWGFESFKEMGPIGKEICLEDCYLQKVYIVANLLFTGTYFTSNLLDAKISV